MDKWFCAWTKVNERGTPSGRIHAVNKETGKSACGNKHAGIFKPMVEFASYSYWGRPWDCRNCQRKVG